MKILDLNLLIYAINKDSDCHETVRVWLESLLSSDELVGLPWVVLSGFIRITTNPRIMPSPLAPEVAMDLVDSWLELPNTRMVHPGDGHWPIFRGLLLESGTAGNLTTDAHLAALAIEHSAVLCSVDNDFGRFAQLKWVNPLQ